ncbi:histidine kinase [Anoxybacter fermentans]|uniref:histidine kinase n=1 Tax=Anoxybacter fermentans TaxID=1323375 RepID=A0A3Q9HQQ8_9FIRM|nr:ATP-binding protein [Anoxybacter fermentans]AZR73307.1 histidine kinase [Anoxybacter fermentans]
MRELSLHILDIAQNSIRAGATEIQIRIDISTMKDELIIEIEDNGCGMSKEMAEKALDPFMTTRTTRRVGLGLPLFKAAAERCDGELELQSEEGKGTLVRARFKLSHIDRAPLGDIAGTIVTLIQGNPEIDFIYRHRYDDQEYCLSTRMLRRELEGIPLNHPEVLEFIAKDISLGLNGMPMEV